MQKEKVLIFKTGHTEILEGSQQGKMTSLGDVLRTTPLLHLFKEDHVTWVTDEEALPLLEKNPYINRLLLSIDHFIHDQLLAERFDTIINLEKVPGICALTDRLNAWKKFGFRYDSENMRAEAYNHASKVLEVSFNSDLKKRNKKCFQDLLFQMLGAKFKGEEPILGYQPPTKEVYDIALNTRAGKKWPNKAWLDKNWEALEKILKKEGYSVSVQHKQDPEILSNLRKYIDWINSSKLIVTNDSLGMHLGFALKKKVIVLFGPTSDKEVYFYGRGKAILPKEKLDCMPCFQPKCNLEESCINKISVGEVYKEIQNYIN